MLLQLTARVSIGWGEKSLVTENCPKTRTAKRSSRALHAVLGAERRVLTYDELPLFILNDFRIKPRALSTINRINN